MRHGFVPGRDCETLFPRPYGDSACRQHSDFTAIYQIPDCVQMVVLSVLRGYNDTKAIFYICCFSYWGLSVPIGYALCYTDFIVKPLGVYGFWIALILGLLCVCLLVNLRVRHLEGLTLEQVKAKISR